MAARHVPTPASPLLHVAATEAVPAILALGRGEKGRAVALAAARAFMEKTVPLQDIGPTAEAEVAGPAGPMAAALPPVVVRPRASVLRQEAVDETVGRRTCARPGPVDVLLQAGGAVVARPRVIALAVLAIVEGLGAEARLPWPSDTGVVVAAAQAVAKAWARPVGVDGLATVAAPAP